LLPFKQRCEREIGEGDARSKMDFGATPWLGGGAARDLSLRGVLLAGEGARFALFVHHDESQREYAYDRADKLQQFNKGWDEAMAKGWTVVSMKDDWNTVFPAAGR
jgi:hypothetical protein